MSDDAKGQSPTPNGITSDLKDNLQIPESSPNNKKEKPAQHRKKSVSFHDNVTDIDAESCNNNNKELTEDEGPCGVQEDNLGDIFNVSEKISFFKNAFLPKDDEGETKKPRPKSPPVGVGLGGSGQQTSIPQARLAFVTGMVQSPPAGNRSRAGQGRDTGASDSAIEAATVAKRDPEEDTGIKKCYVVSVEVPPEEVKEGVRQSQKCEGMATTLTYSKIFAQQRTMVVDKNKVVEAVVDTSSILEHREELRELWEKRMMADENQSSSSSTVTETNDSTKPHQEEDAEEKTVEKSESESAKHHKMSNGIAKHSADAPDGNANHIHDRAEIAKEEPVVLHSTANDADQENNNSADSLEEDNVEDYVEQKTYTSNLEQALVMTETKVSSSSETQVTSSLTTITTTTTKVEEEMHETSEETVQMETQELVTTANKEEHHTEQVATTVEAEKVEEESTTTVVEDHRQETTSEVAVEEKATVPEKETTPEVDAVAHQEESLTPTPAEESVIQDHHKKVESMSEKIVIPDVEGDGEDDGFVRVEECLPKDDSADEILDMPEEHDEQSHEERDVPSSNGFEEQSLPVSPISSTASDKVSPEMEQFVKSGGVKRIIPGVQKTEQPYNTCTTETKIAMEIREMREREEELRLMREQALLSPVVSPVPPKTPTSVRTPSPSPKEGPSPVPQSGPGYRVSSVFGHRGISPSPSVEEEKKTYKTFSKESAVEKEIRLAKDREEELRRQKGLPPREDDSYVKPSQVKSSQVRVFGKMAGTNSNIKQAATAKIQMEIEEQTQREMALRETGHIQTISQERTDSKVAKLKTAENVHQTNGNSPSPVNGNGYTNGFNGRSSPDSGVPYKRSSPSPTNARPASIFAQNGKGNISMHKFISSKGKETTFSAPRNGPFQPPKEESISRSAVPPPMVKLKRNVSVESKIQQEILEMKQREEELKKMHMHMMSNGNSVSNENETEHEMNQNNLEYENGNGVCEEEISPRHNKLIAQWEQRIQKAES